jgi:hypothetical protein
VKYLLVIILAVFITSAFAQPDTSFTLLRSYEGIVADAALDHLDNLYIISPSGQVKKIGPKGDSLALYNQVRNAGKLFSVDVSNPLKPLLFYKDFSSVVILDRLLSPRASIDLRKSSILSPLAVGLSYDNNIWVFDAYDSKLKKLDEQGSVLFESADFRGIFPENFAPQKIINEGGLLYLADTSSGVFVFDNYGTFRKKLGIRGWSQLSLSNGMIVRTMKDEVLIYDPASFSDRSRKLPASFLPYQSAFATNNRIITISTGRVNIYRFRF